MSTGLVACAAQKLDRAAPARLLYTSALFRKASVYAERVYDRWYVLSALHGIVSPDAVIDPYDRTLNAMTAAERQTWGVMVLEHCRSLGLFSDTLYLHAGTRYRAPFRDMARIVVPLAGLGIGQQLRWYLDQEKV